MIVVIVMAVVVVNSGVRDGGEAYHLFVFH